MTSLREQFRRLPRYSFIRGSGGGVQRVRDRSGNWIEQHEAAAIVEIMQDRIDHWKASSACTAASSRGQR
jgi:hypothetical protein